MSNYPEIDAKVARAKADLDEVYAAGIEEGKAQGGGGGGSSPAVQMKDVNFYDYDGTRLYSYTVAEAQALTDLPPLPTREGLICQEWNWTLDEIKAHNRAVDVGATYITDDGKTRLYITIAAEGRMDVPLYFRSAGSACSLMVDWGDGTPVETVSVAMYSSKRVVHTYQRTGEYTISFIEETGKAYCLGSSSSTNAFGDTNDSTAVYRSMLRKVEYGKNIQNIGAYAFNKCTQLKAVVISDGHSTMVMNTFSNCPLLDFIVVPRSVPKLLNDIFAGLNIKRVSLPPTISEIGDRVVSSCTSLSAFVIPPGVVSIPEYTFYNCLSLASLIIPSGVEIIENAAFQNCCGMKFYDFTSHTSVPTLSSTTAFGNIPSDCEIRVPAALYNEWIAATNWSTYASNIVAV